MVYHILKSGLPGRPTPHAVQFLVGNEFEQYEEDDDQADSILFGRAMQLLNAHEMMILRNPLYRGKLSYNEELEDYFAFNQLKKMKKIQIALNDKGFLRRLLGDLSKGRYHKDMRVTITAYPSLLEESEILSLLSKYLNSPFSPERVTIQTYDNN